MLNNYETGLRIFDNFNIDNELPKWQKMLGQKQSGGRINLDPQQGNDITIGRVDGIWPEMSVPSANIETTSILIQKHHFTNSLTYPNKKGDLEYKKDTFWLRLKIMWQFLNNKSLSRVVNPPTITIQEYFRSIKMSCQELEKLDDRMNGYVTAVKHADDFGQKTLSDDLKSRIEIIKLESRLYSMGLTKVITEEQVVNFYKEAEKGIQLVWVRNFKHIIPAALLETKKRADELEIFDNYVVMHYDTLKKSYKQTKEEYEKTKAEEIRKRKDPILFGVLKDSRKLYYVGSWEDDYCDLTLDKFIEKYGEDAITKNDINVNKY